MSDGTTVVIKGITGPDTCISIIKPVIIGIVIQLLPCQMADEHRPHLAGILQISRPVEMPKQFVYIAKIHVVMMHLGIVAGITANIPIAVLGSSPPLFRTGQIKDGILCRMRYRVGNLCDLAGRIGIKMRTGPIVPA